MYICVNKGCKYLENAQKPLFYYANITNRLSGGEQKKLILALTMARRSQILLRDEPKVSLAQVSDAILSRILQKDQQLILLVTHNPVFDSIATGSITVQGGKICVKA